jgi:8-oxo-dGTP pyrophosphatase MutT (NUDIX family)
MYSDFFRSLKLELEKDLPGLSAQLKMAPEIRPSSGYGKGLNAGVLILLYLKNKDIYLSLIKRTEYDGAHSGQISLPGGKYEEIDQTLIQTAIRESQEEIGIDPGEIEILGTITPLHIPVSNFFVQPVVGMYKSTPVFVPDLNEVEKVLEIKLTDFLNPINKSSTEFKFGTINFDAPIYKPNNLVIWGATAMILSEFLEIVDRIKVNLPQ